METIDIQIQLAEAQSAIHVPGAWRCAKCGFELTKSLLCVRSGNIGVDLAQETEPCPNDGEPMDRTTWKGDAMRLATRACDMMQRERSLSDRFAARAKHCRWLEQRELRFVKTTPSAIRAAEFWRGRAEAWEIAALNLTQSNAPL